MSEREIPIKIRTIYNQDKEMMINGNETIHDLMQESHLASQIPLKNFSLQFGNIYLSKFDYRIGDYDI